MTLKEIRDQVKIDADVLSDVNFRDARLNHIINQAQRYVQTELNGLGMKKWETHTDFTTLTADTFAGVNVKTYAVPTDMLESPRSIIQIEIDDTGGGSGLAKEISQSDFYDTCNNTFQAPTITQAIYARMDNKIYFAPSTIQEGVIHYYKVIAELSSDATESDIPTEFTEYVVRRAVSQVEKIQGKLDVALIKEKDVANDIATAYEKFLGKVSTEKQTEILS